MSAKKQARNGKSASSGIENNSNQPLLTPATKELKQKLAEVYKNFNSAGNRKQQQQRRDWFVFHMTDWLDDLKKMESLYARPDEFSDEAASDIVAAFLYHALNHLTASARLLLDYRPGDVFSELEEKPGFQEVPTGPKES